MLVLENQFIFSYQTNRTRGLKISFIIIKSTVLRHTNCHAHLTNKPLPSQLNNRLQLFGHP